MTACSSFYDEVSHAASIWPASADLFEKWNGHVAQRLRSVRSQIESLKHPRSKGDAVESEITSILRDLLPSSLRIERGFAANSYMCVSREQDALVIDRGFDFSITNSKSDRHFPIECILGSFEIKSNVNKRSIKSSILNCISLKNLTFHLKSENTLAEQSKHDRIRYTVLGLHSDLTLDRLCDIANSLVVERHFPLYPDVISVLGRGFLIKGVAGAGISIGAKQPEEKEYVAIEAFARPGEDHGSHALLWPAMTMIDHSSTQISLNPITKSAVTYIFAPSFLRQQIREDMERRRGDSELL